MLENPIILAALTCFVLGLALSGLARVVPGPALASIVLPIIFLASYVLTYQQVPDFPPIGATNKIFYIALAAALVGFALDLLPRLASYRKLLAVIMPLSIVAWIGFPRFAKPDIELIATALGLWLGGIALLWRLEIVATTPADRNGGSIVGTAMLMALMRWLDRLSAFCQTRYRVDGDCAGPMARWHCLAVAPGDRCDFAGRAKWGQYRRHRNADGALSRSRRSHFLAVLRPV